MTMNKKFYIQPKTEVVEIKMQHHLLVLSDPTPPSVSAPEFDLSNEEPLILPGFEEPVQL